MDMMLLFDVLLALAGVFAMTQWVKLKTAGKLVDCKLIYPSECSADNCRDPEGFYAYVQLRLLLFSVAALISGVLLLANDFLHFLSDLASMAVGVVFFVIIIWYGAVISRAYKRFFQG